MDISGVNCVEILVTGGSGLVGNALQKIQPDAVYISSKDYDLTLEKDVKAMFEKYKPKKVIHLAAQVGGIKHNMEHPAELLYQNVIMNTLVVHYAHKYNVGKLIGVLSNCAYPDVAKSYPLKEEQLFDSPPQITNFSYAYSKRTLAVQIEAYRKQYNCNFFSVIPCNMYGPSDNFDEKQSHFLAALIRKIRKAKKNNEKTLNLLGSGKPLRQYLFSEDFAKILIMLLDKYDGGGPINIAQKNENFSIAEIAEIALDAIDIKGINIKFDKSFPDGQFRKDLDVEKLYDVIGDFKFTSLSNGIKKTYDWYLKNIEV